MSRMITPQAFEFRSDFSSPDDSASGRMVLAAEELAVLLAQARDEGLAEGRQQTASKEAAKMDAAAIKLNEALGDLVKLAEHLEACGHDPEMAKQATGLINAAAGRIIDGQGDLFPPFLTD